MAEWHRIITSPYTGSMSMSGSFNVDGDATITGNVTINGTASVENLIVKQIGYSSGSNQLGDAANDTQTLFGSVIIPTGSLTVTGSLNLKSTTSNTATLLTLQVSESSASTLAFTDKVPKLTLISNTEGPSALGTGPDYLLELNKTGASGGPRVGIRIISSGTNTSIESYRSVTTGVVNYISTGILNGSTEVLTVAGNLNVGINNTDPTAKLAIKGSGATSSTTALLIQNSNASSSFAIRDDKALLSYGSEFYTNIGNAGGSFGWSISGNETYFTNNQDVYLNGIGLIRGGAGYRVGIAAQTFPPTNASAMLTITSTTRGLLPPRTNLLSNISNPAQGLITYLTSSGNEGLWYYNSGSYQGWTEILNNSGSQNITGSLSISGIPSTSSAALTVYKSGSTVVDVQGSSGQLFSVTDSLSGSLFSVNTAAGLPTIEAFSDNTVNIGKFGTYPIKVVSLGTSAVVSGSFSGSGADLSGIPASAIVGLNLSQIATGSVTASVGLGTGSFTITSGSSNFLFVSSSGNVGIGTTATTDKLTVNGSIAFSSYNNTIGSGTYPATAVYSAALVGATTISDGGGAGIKFTDSGGSAYAKMGFGNLNTTIGQSSYGVVPDLGARLGVRGAGTTASTTSFLVQNANASASLQVKDDGYVEITNSNNINIPFQVQQGNLKVYPNFNGGVNALTLETNAAYGNRVTFYNTGYGSTYHIGQAYYANRLAVYDNNYTELTSWDLANMRVGIGTTSPTYKLDVSGSGNFTDGLTVTGSLNLTSALTASSAIISGNVTVLGTASINTLIVNQTQLSTGSNQLGDAADDFQTLYGTVRIPTGSLTVTGSVNITGSAGAITVGRATSTVGLVHIQKPANSTLANLYLATPYPSTTPTNILFQNNDFGGGATGTGSINWSTDGTYFNISNRVLLGAGQTSIDLTPGSLITLSRVGAGDLQLNFLQGGVASYVIRNVSGQNALAFITNGVTATTAEAARFTANSNFLVGTTSDVARVAVKGSGATSSTTSLLVQNANASSSLVVLDNGSVGINVVPSKSLHINGDYRQSFATEFFNYYIDYTYPVFAGSDVGLAVNQYNVGSTYNNVYTIRKGNFAIGTTSLIDKFTVSGSSNLIGNTKLTGSLSITGSAGTGSALTVYKSGSTVMSIQGSQGELFSITDSLSGSLFSVSNVSGLPILEVFSDNTTLVGDYLAPALITTKRMTVNSGSTVIYSLPTASYDGAFFDYTIKSGSNARAGSIFGTYISTTASYTDTSTFDIGDTTGVAFALIVSGSNMVLTGSASTSGWALKTIIRSI